MSICVNDWLGGGDPCRAKKRLLGEARLLPRHACCRGPRVIKGCGSLRRGRLTGFELRC